MLSEQEAIDAYLVDVTREAVARVQVVPWKNFNIRDDGHIRDVVKRSNVVFNLIGAERETWNFSFEDVHVDAATRIAQAAAENPLTERFIHVSCIGASRDAASRRLRTKARHFAEDSMQHPVLQVCSVCTDTRAPPSTRVAGRLAGSGMRRGCYMTW